MNALPLDLSAIVFSYLSLDDWVCVAQVSQRYYQLLTDPNYLKRITTYRSDLPPPEALARGLKKFLDSRFYRHHLKPSTVHRIRKIQEVYFRHVISYGARVYTTDIFDRLGHEGGKELWFRRYPFPKGEVVKELSSCCRRVKGEFINSLLRIDYQGNLIIQDQKFDVGAQKVLAWSYEGDIAFVNRDNRCCVLRDGVVSFLPEVPLWRELELYCCTQDNIFHLSYCLTMDNNLHYQYWQSLENMNKSNQWNEPLRSDVRKVVYFTKESYLVLTTDNQLIFWNNGYLGYGNGEFCLLTDVLDAVRCYSNVYALKKGAVYCQELWREPFHKIISNVPWTAKHLRVEQLDGGYNNIVQVW